MAYNNPLEPPSPPPSPFFASDGSTPSPPRTPDFEEIQSTDSDWDLVELDDFDQEEFTFPAVEAPAKILHFDDEQDDEPNAVSAEEKPDEVDEDEKPKETVANANNRSRKRKPV